MNGLWCSSSTLDDDREGTLMTHAQTHTPPKWEKAVRLEDALFPPLPVPHHFTAFQYSILFFSSAPPFIFHHYSSMKSNSSWCLVDQIKPSYLTICWAGVLDCPAPFQSCSPFVLSKFLSQTSLTLCVVSHSKTLNQLLALWWMAFGKFSVNRLNPWLVHQLCINNF